MDENMSVSLQVPGFLRDVANDARLATVTGSTVGECLGDFVVQFPAAKERLFDKDGNLLRYIDIFVNGKSTFPEELARPVASGDELSLLFLIAGG